MSRGLTLYRMSCVTTIMYSKMSRGLTLYRMSCVTTIMYSKMACRIVFKESHAAINIFYLSVKRLRRLALLLLLDLVLVLVLMKSAVSVDRLIFIRILPTCICRLSCKENKSSFKEQ